MEKNTDNLGAQLHDLKCAGKILLPEMARHYTQASRDLHNTRWYDDPEAPAFASIAALRDTLQTLMVETFNSFIANGKALVAIADHYAATDEEAAREMKKLWDERMSDPELSQSKEPMPTPKDVDAEPPQVRIEKHRGRVFEHVPETEFEYKVEVPVR